VLYKRDNFRRAFDGFDPSRIARYTPADRRRLMSDPGIIRNRLKIDAAIANAQAYLHLKKQLGSFSAFLWTFTGYTTLRQPRARSWQDVPDHRPESDAMARDLKDWGFRFVGTTICYAFMQAVGMVDDHLDGCFRARDEPRPSTD
jgi:DNA-3-methyladenine glycosylase I